MRSSAAEPHYKAQHPPVSERRILLLICAVQFVNLLDFMLVMPLGFDFTADLDMRVSDIGWVGGAYTAAAALSGLLAARVLDRYDRRTALAVTLVGLVLGTAAAGISRDLYTLMAARVVAGGFGGPASALSLSIIADVVPPARRGRAMSIVMGAFSLASVLGLPCALELARLAGWRSAFFGVAGLGAVIASAAVWLMPALRAHITAARPSDHASEAGAPRPAVIYALVCTFTVMMASFSVIPNVSGFVQGNLHYPRAGLGVLYFAGGTASFIGMRLIGPVIDRLGATFAGSLGTAAFVAIVAAAFLVQAPVPAMLIYGTLMTSMSIRNVVLGAACSRVPLAHERARFMSLQSTVQHSAAAAGSIVSAQLLTERADHSLLGMREVAVLAIGLALFLPWLLRHIEKHIAARENASIAGALPALAQQDAG